MANRKNNVSFKKGIIHFEEDGKILFEEITKDGSFFYDLIKELKEFNGVENVSISFGNDKDIAPIREA
jgi:hypothetical protein